MKFCLILQLRAPKNVEEIFEALGEGGGTNSNDFFFIFDFGFW